MRQKERLSDHEAPKDNAWELPEHEAPKGNAMKVLIQRCVLEHEVINLKDIWMLKRIGYLIQRESVLLMQIIKVDLSIVWFELP